MKQSEETVQVHSLRKYTKPTTVHFCILANYNHLAEAQVETKFRHGIARLQAFSCKLTNKLMAKWHLPKRLEMY